MIVRLDFEGDGQSIADVHDAGVLLASAHENFLRLGWERFEQRAGVFVGAMFAPHHGEDAQFGVIRLAAEDLADALKFLRRQAVLCDQFGSDGVLYHFKMLSG